MSKIDVFYQGDGVGDLEHVEIDDGTTIAELKKLFSDKHGFDGDALVFLEDEDDPLDELADLKEHTHQAGVKAHVHRCRRVEVVVTFNGEAVDRSFGPGATIAKVKKWAAERKFEMSECDAGEHVLQITGTDERPAPGIHVGSLVACPKCRIEFDLVPDQRINGAE